MLMLLCFCFIYAIQRPMKREGCLSRPVNWDRNLFRGSRARLHSSPGAISTKNQALVSAAASATESFVRRTPRRWRRIGEREMVSETRRGETRTSQVSPGQLSAPGAFPSQPDLMVPARYSPGPSNQGGLIS
ncbi:hypothetical protein BKA56DRAFT_125011 [Ilyonectria sp. MPI-CAGE-AT-0026]|nr:hypothetical protein BKA56DRAFT_125011 [Ilyonectria sp. MPI-CAGE-AT-0026]